MIYRFLHITITWVLWFFHSNWKVKGKTNIPKDMPVIFAPNHQNGLHDPLIVICSQAKRPNSWVRSDVFKNPIAAKFFDAVKMMPIYRIRDGKDQMHKNDAIFAEAKRRMDNGESFLIFPEASHDMSYRVRNLKKGLARLAFTIDHPKGVAIVPTSMHFDNHAASRAGFHITFQEPVLTKDFEALFEENPQRALRLVNQSLSDKIKKGIWHINRNDLHDELVTSIKTFWALKGIKKVENRLEKAQELTQQMEARFEKSPDLVAQFKALAQSFMESAKQLRLPQDVKTMNMVTCFAQGLALLLGLPVFLMAFFNAWLFVWLPGFITKLIFYDKHYHSDGKIGFSFLGGLLLFPLQILVLNLFFDWGFMENVLYLVFTIGCAYFAFYFKKWLLAFFKNIRFSFLLKIGDPIAKKFERSRNELMALLMAK